MEDQLEVERTTRTTSGRPGRSSDHFFEKLQITMAIWVFLDVPEATDSNLVKKDEVPTLWGPPTEKNRFFAKFVILTPIIGRFQVTYQIVSVFTMTTSHTSQKWLLKIFDNYTKTGFQAQNRFSTKKCHFLFTVFY